MRIKKLMAWLMIPALAYTFATPALAEEPTEETPEIDYTEEFANRREYYIELCHSDSLGQETQERCIQFNEYLKAKNEEAQAMVEKLQTETDEIIANIEEYIPIIQEYDAQLLSIESDIEKLNSLIETYNGPLQEATNQMLSISNEIEVIKLRQAARIEKLKGFSGTEKLYKFVVGREEVALDNAISNFLEHVDSIKSENLEIEEKKLEIQEISEGRTEASEGLNAVNALKEQLAADMKIVNDLKTSIQQIVAGYKGKQAELEAEKSGYIEDIDGAKAIVESISKNIVGLMSSDSFIYPVKNFRVSAQAWNYPASFGNGLHLGIDFAANMGEPVLAPANGVVLYSSDTCADNGYLGNKCGQPGVISGGNQVHLIVVVNEELYAVSFAHLQHGSTIRSGTEVKQGDVIGKIGKSGNTTGPHTHVEVFKLNGYTSIQEFLEDWDMDLSFGNGFGTKGYGNRCDVNRAGGICRVNPNNIFGLKVGDTAIDGIKQ